MTPPINPSSAALRSAGHLANTSADVIDMRPLLAALPKHTQKRPRIALYSHDTMGLGHIRRNLLLAQALSGAALDADILLITSAREAGSFQLPEGVDCLILPSLTKGPNGDYQARRLHLPLKALITMRAQILLSTIRSFKPDLFIVDNVARGVEGELDTTLSHLRTRGTRCVLGLRDIRDDAKAVCREWARQGFEEAVSHYYDQIWVYGDPSICDPRTEYGLSCATSEKVRFLGYLDQSARLQPHAGRPLESLLKALGIDRPFHLCMVGGGQDGQALTLAFARTRLPDGHQGLIITGPHMDEATQRELNRILRRNPCMRVTPFVAEPTLILSAAERVVAMGGYNTTCEILSFNKTALIVPRVKPRQEQLVRAERLQHMGLVDMLHPDQLTPDALGAWLSQPRDTERETSRRTAMPDLGGLDRLAHQVRSLLRLPKANTLDFERPTV